MALSGTQRRVNRVTNVNNTNSSYARSGGSRRQTAMDAAAYFAQGDARLTRNARQNASRSLNKAMAKENGKSLV